MYQSGSCMIFLLSPRAARRRPPRGAATAARCGSRAGAIRMAQDQWPTASLPRPGPPGRAAAAGRASCHACRLVALRDGRYVCRGSGRGGRRAADLGPLPPREPRQLTRRQRASAPEAAAQAAPLSADGLWTRVRPPPARQATLIQAAGKPPTSTGDFPGTHACRWT